MNQSNLVFLISSAMMVLSLQATAAYEPSSTRPRLLRFQDPTASVVQQSQVVAPQPLSAQEAKRALMELISEFDGRFMTADGSFSFSYSLSYSFSYGNNIIQNEEDYEDPESDSSSDDVNDPIEKDDDVDNDGIISDVGENESPNLPVTDVEHHNILDIEGDEASDSDSEQTSNNDDGISVLINLDDSSAGTASKAASPTQTSSATDTPEDQDQNGSSGRGGLSSEGLVILITSLVVGLSLFVVLRKLGVFVGSGTSNSQLLHPEDASSLSSYAV